MRANAIVLSCLTIVLAAGLCQMLLERVAAQGDDSWEKGLPRQYKSEWLVLDRNRPLPPVVTPGGSPGAPPSDAVVLFDGKDLSKWTVDPKTGAPARWKVEGGYMEINSTGSISTRDSFGDCQLHIEWMAPSPPKSEDQGRGNSGIFMMSNYEIQVLDSFENVTYAEGVAASLYGQHPPLANACRKPGEWQAYDVIFRAPRFVDGKVAEPARVTLLHNGVLAQHNAEVFGSTVYRALATYQEHPDALPISLQDHGDKQPVRYRNIWVRRLDLTKDSGL